MGPFEMVVAIVGIGAVASIYRAKHGLGHFRRGDGRRGGWSQAGDDAGLVAENKQLRDEMQGMKQRIQVLERLATDDASDARRLDREIEKLRDKPAVANDRPGE